MYSLSSSRFSGSCEDGSCEAVGNFKVLDWHRLVYCTSIPWEFGKDNIVFYPSKKLLCHIGIDNCKDLLNTLTRMLYKTFLDEIVEEVILGSRKL